MLIPAIQTWFGYEVATETRFAAIRAAGFQRIAPFLGDPIYLHERPVHEQMELAARHGLGIDSVHYPFIDTNAIWQDGEFGERVCDILIECVRKTALYSIRCGVMHLTRTFEPPPFSETGYKRICRIIEEAERLDVKVAFENLARNDYIDRIFAKLHSKQIRICYDAGHEYAYGKTYNVLECYSTLVEVIHLSDNFGMRDEHLLPFEGSIDWVQTMQRISAIGYSGGVVLEASNDPVRTPNRSMEQFLQDAFTSAMKLVAIYQGTSSID